MERRGFLATCAAALGFAAVPKVATPTLSKVVLRPGVLPARIYMTKELLDDCMLPLSPEHLEQLVTGTGVNQPLGILNRCRNDDGEYDERDPWNDDDLEGL